MKSEVASRVTEPTNVSTVCRMVFSNRSTGHRACGRLRAGQISLDLDGPYRLIFEVANNPIPLKTDGGLDWIQVTSIKILEVEDTHE